MDNNHIIEQLRVDAEYYRGIGRQYLSNSDIGVLLSNPKEYGKSREDNKSFLEGRYFHQLILEPHKAIEMPFVDVSSRNTKEYKNYIEETGLEIVMLRKEKEYIEYLTHVIKSNIVFYDEIYKEGNKYEEPAIGEICGMMWKGKADIITDTCIIDLKTTSDINKFKYSAKAYNYDSQCYIYQQLFNKPLVFYAIDKESAQLGVFSPSDNFLESGRRKVERAVEVYQKYYGPNASDNIINYFINETLD